MLPRGTNVDRELTYQERMLIQHLTMWFAAQGISLSEEGSVQASQRRQKIYSEIKEKGDQSSVFNGAVSRSRTTIPTFPLELITELSLSEEEKDKKGVNVNALPLCPLSFPCPHRTPLFLISFLYYSFSATRLFSIG